MIPTYEAIKNWTIINQEVMLFTVWGRKSWKKLTIMHIIMYSTVHWMGSKESKEAHYNAYYHVYSTVHQIGSKESKEIALLHSKEC